MAQVYQFTGSQKQVSLSESHLTGAGVQFPLAYQNQDEVNSNFPESPSKRFKSESGAPTSPPAQPKCSGRSMKRHGDRLGEDGTKELHEHCITENELDIAVASGTGHTVGIGEATREAQLTQMDNWQSVQDTFDEDDLGNSNFEEELSFSLEVSSRDDQASPDQSLMFTQPLMYLKTLALPVLCHLSEQITKTLIAASVAQLNALADRTSVGPSSQAWTTMTTLFDQTLKTYPCDRRVLEFENILIPRTSAEDINKTSTQIIHQTNKTLAAVALLCPAHDSSYELLKLFFEIFPSPRSGLNFWQTVLFHDWSMQVLIARARRSGNQDFSSLIDDLFPVNTEAWLRSTIPIARDKALTVEEAALVQKFEDTRTYLTANLSLDELSTTHSWAGYLQGISRFVRNNIRDDLIDSAAIDKMKGIPTGIADNAETSFNIPKDTSTLLPAQTLNSEIPGVSVFEDKPFDMMAFLRNAEIAAQRTVNELNITPVVQEASLLYPTYQSFMQHSPQSGLNQASYAQPSQYGQDVASQPSSEHAQASSTTRIALPLTTAPATTRLGSQGATLPAFYPAQHIIDLTTAQTVSTQAQYEKARQAASAKAATKNRPAPLNPSQRRPWSQEEETALMTGLDHVQGPHWSQILAMYGTGGSINEVLRDRNQVQLKDKARNLKLFFLKSGLDVPAYLRHVTGDLKSRALTKTGRRGSDSNMEDRIPTDVAPLAPSATLGRTSLDTVSNNDSQAVSTASPVASPHAELVPRTNALTHTPSQHEDDLMTNLLRQELTNPRQSSDDSIMKTQ